MLSSKARGFGGDRKTIEPAGAPAFREKLTLSGQQTGTNFKRDCGEIPKTGKNLLFGFRSFDLMLAEREKAASEGQRFSSELRSRPLCFARLRRQGHRKVKSQ
jgi:hypothetical protein